MLLTSGLSRAAAWFYRTKLEKLSSLVGCFFPGWLQLAVALCTHHRVPALGNPEGGDSDCGAARTLDRMAALQCFW